MADPISGRARIHRKRVERVHQRRDLLAETHVESRRPRKRRVREDQEDSESPAVPYRHASHLGRPSAIPTHGNGWARRGSELIKSPHWRSLICASSFDFTTGANASRSISREG